MAGFRLPKLRWLIIGAVAAGAWAMTQDPPPPRERAVESAARETAAPKRQSEGFKAKPARKEEAELPSVGDRVALPQERPSEIITAAIPRPEAKVEPAPKAASGKFATTSKVRLRGKPDTAGEVLATLPAGETVKVHSRKGEWSKVSVGGRDGWIHSDFLAALKPVEKTAAKAAAKSAEKPAEKTARKAVESENAEELVDVQRPKADVPKAISPKADVTTVSAPAPRPQSSGSSGALAGADEWGALRPARPPQGGDCQCPYDLMLSGKQCGERSAYARSGGTGPACYF